MANEVSVDVKINGLGQSATGVKQLTDALNGLATPTKKVEQNISSLEKSMTDLASKGFSKFGAIATGAIASVAALFAGKEIINAAREKEDSINSLNVTLASLGIYSQKTSEDLQAFADQIAKTTKFSDDQVISSINLLGAITRLDEQGLKSASKASLDLSSALKIDLDAATRLVAKSIEGETGALSKYGIQVKKGTTETENLANTLEGLSKFAGRSEKDINTFSGAVAFLTNSFDNVLVAIGKIIVSDPIIVGVIKNLGNAFNSLADTIEEMKLSITDSLISLLQGFLNFGLNFRTIAQTIEAVITTVLIVGFVSLAIAIQKFAVQSIASMVEFGLAMTNAGTRGVIAFQALGTASSAAATGMKILTGALSAGLLLVLGELIFLLIRAKDEVGGWANLFTKSVINIQLAFKYLLVLFEQARSSINDLVFSFAKGAQDILNKYRTLIGLPPIEFKIKNTSFEEGAKRVQKLNADISDLSDQITKLEDEAKKGKTDLFENSVQSLRTLKEEFNKTKTAFTNSKGEGAKVLLDPDKIKKDFEGLYRDLAGLDQGELGRAKAVYEQKRKTITDFIANNKDQETKGKDALRILELDFQKQLTDIQKKQQEERIKLRQEEVNKAKANPLGVLAGIDKDLTKEVDLVIKPKVQGLVEGFGEAFKRGKEGAQNLLISATSSAIDTILPGVGTALKPFIEVFAQGPEATQKMVEEFLGAVPQFVTNFVRSVPAFITAIIKEVPKLINALIAEVPRVFTEFANNIPVIINEFARQMPYVVSALSVQMPVVANQLALQMPFIAWTFITALVKNIPYLVIETTNQLVDAITSAFSGGLFGGGGGGDGLLGLGVFGLAKGGEIVKGGIAGKDSVPIATMPGELIVDRDLTSQMKEFFSDRPSGRDSDVTDALLSKIISLLTTPQEITTSVQFNNRTLAEILINLNRTNARVTI